MQLMRLFRNAMTVSEIRMSSIVLKETLAQNEVFLPIVLVRYFLEDFSVMYFIISDKCEFLK